MYSVVILHVAADRRSFAAKSFTSLYASTGIASARIHSFAGFPHILCGRVAFFTHIFPLETRVTFDRNVYFVSDVCLQ